MRKLAFLFTLFVVAISATSFVTPASAQATRTWVSGVGDDVNPCSRTAPCKTFAGAISKTATRGEISVLDPGGYGAVTITKAITIDGGTGAGWASILHSGGSGVIINITTNLATDKVILRNLSINGAGTTLGTNSVRFLDGASLTLENVHIFNFSGNGVDIAQSQAANLFLKNVKITNGAVGIRSTTAAGAINGTVEDVHIDAMSSHGIQAVSNTFLSIRNLNSSRNGGDGVRTEAASTGLNVQDSTVHGNNFGFNAVAGNIRLHNNLMVFNNTNLSANVLSDGTNRSAGNTTTNVPTPGAFTVN